MEDIVEEYFFEGYQYVEILDLLKKDHNIMISLSTLKRSIKKLGLKRKSIEESDINDIISVMRYELDSVGLNLGYRALWSKLKEKYHLIVKRETVYNLMKILDPDGLQSRLAKKFKRREYVSPGPNFIWHLDGYDKLKPYGFAIHGCIDGFSRYLLWLRVASTNNNPRVTANYFLNSVKENECVPVLIRSDKGTENCIIESLQMCLRENHEDKLKGEKSYIKGTSVHNQRIESYWGKMRKHSADYFIDLFKDLTRSNLFDGSDLHKNCLRYCFGPVIEEELYLTRKLWNQHCIREQKGQNNVGGKPNSMYKLPENFQAKDYHKHVDMLTIDELIAKVTEQPQLVDPDFKEIADRILDNPPKSSNSKEAIHLYAKLIGILES